MEINRHHLKSPVEIVTTKLGIPLNYKQQCIDEIYKIGDKQNNQTNVKAIMSSYWIWDDTDVLNPLMKEILNTISKLFPIKDDTQQYKLIDCWSTIYKKGHHTVPHKHKHYPISWVYYLKSNPNSSPLVFNECNFHIPPEDDLLVVFPNHFIHSVPTQTDNEDRIGLAGDVILELKK